MSANLGSLTDPGQVPDNSYEVPVSTYRVLSGNKSTSLVTSEEMKAIYPSDAYGSAKGRG